MLALNCELSQFEIHAKHGFLLNGIINVHALHLFISDKPLAMLFVLAGAHTKKKSKGHKDKIDCTVCESLDVRLPEQTSVTLQACVDICHNFQYVHLSTCIHVISGAHSTLCLRITCVHDPF